MGATRRPTLVVRRGGGRGCASHQGRAGARQGASSVYLEVRPSNLPAIELYQKLGFNEIGRRPKYYTDSKEDAVVMMKDIEMNLPHIPKSTKKNSYQEKHLFMWI